MVDVYRYEDTSEKDWNDFCLSAKNSIFLFQRKFMEYHKDRFVDASLIVKKDSKIIALFPCSINGKKVVSHGGLTYGGIIVGKDMRTSLFLEIFELILSYYKHLDFTALVIKPLPAIFTNLASAEQEYALFLANAKLVKRDVSTVIKFCDRGKLSKGRKWIINKAKKNDIQIIESDDFERFIEFQNSALEKHEAASVHQSHELKYLHDNYPNNIKLIMAKNSLDELLAASLIFIFDNVVHTQYLATSSKGKEIGALDLLIENQIQFYKEQTQTYFSFGISTTNDGRFLNKGLCQQKESFGGSTIVVDTYEVEL